MSMLISSSPLLSEFDDVVVVQLFENIELPVPLLCLPEIDDVVVVQLLDYSSLISLLY